MKRITIVTILAMVVLFLVGCGSNLPAETQQQNATENNLSIELCSTPLTADVVYRLSDTIEQIETASSQWQTLDYASLAEAYVNNAEANEEFATYYRNSDRVDAYPILGTYLEPTGSAVYLLYQKEEPYAVAELSFDSAGNVTGTPVCKDMTNPSKTVDAQSIEACYLSIVQCFSETPDFDVMGIALPSKGYPATYAVGKQKGEAVIKYMAGQAESFNLVEPFETLKDGCDAYKKYFTERKQKLSEIMTFLWAEYSFDEAGYMQHMNATYSSGNMPSYMEKYDSQVAVPLLSPDLKENVYILHLLYYRNQLIAEVVIERKKEIGITYSVVWENVGAKDQDGEYIPLESSQYVKVLNSAAAHRAAWESQGVVYDNGKLIPVGIYNGKLMAFDCSTNIVDVYK